MWPLHHVQVSLTGCPALPRTSGLLCPRLNLPCITPISRFLKLMVSAQGLQRTSRGRSHVEQAMSMFFLQKLAHAVQTVNALFWPFTLFSNCPWLMPARLLDSGCRTSHSPDSSYNTDDSVSMLKIVHIDLTDPLSQLSANAWPCLRTHQAWSLHSLVPCIHTTISGPAG